MSIETMVTPAEADVGVKYIQGAGVRVLYDESTQKLTLLRLEDEAAIPLGESSAPGYPVVRGRPVRDFAGHTCSVERGVLGLLGEGERMIITSRSESTGLCRTYLLETSRTEKGAVYTQSFYRAKDTAVVEACIENAFELVGCNDRIWSYNGGGEGPGHYYNSLQKIDLRDGSRFCRENIQDCTAAAIPVADIYAGRGGIAVGDACARRREVHTPVRGCPRTAEICISWPGGKIPSGGILAAGQSFIIVHGGDYFSALRGYSRAMRALGVIMRETVPERSYSLRWETWGWGTGWTTELISARLSELASAGVCQITIDDGWYDSPGDWNLSPEKFPNGTADMRRLTDLIHSYGMTAILWWRPCDGGREGSTLYREHPEYFVMNADKTTAKLGGPGVAEQNGWYADLGYALCPTSEGALSCQCAFINRAMREWGIDGFKASTVWSMPKCYAPSHLHKSPQESTERQAELYGAAYAAMTQNDPDCFNLISNCGAPQDFYSLPYVTQVSTADPITLDQTRRRVKAYKALMGDSFPITTDHNRVWYPSAVGTGAVLIEKRALTGAARAEYERWLGIASRVCLHRGRFIGDLYSYGFDPYETYVVERDGIMHYAFFRDGGKYQPVGSPGLELRGLSPDKMYRIVDYVRERVVATNLPGSGAVFCNEFSSYLLVKAVPIDTPDSVDVFNPNEGFCSVDCMAPEVLYTGVWHDDSFAALQNRHARYTSGQSATAELTFTGTAVRWYGQRDTNFGTAEVFLDGKLAGEVDAAGSPETGRVLFEAAGLSAGKHTIKLVRKTRVIDIDRFCYKK